MSHLGGGGFLFFDFMLRQHEWLQLVMTVTGILLGMIWGGIFLIKVCRSKLSRRQLGRWLKGVGGPGVFIFSGVFLICIGSGWLGHGVDAVSFVLQRHMLEGLDFIKELPQSVIPVEGMAASEGPVDVCDRPDLRGTGCPNTSDE